MKRIRRIVACILTGLIAAALLCGACLGEAGADADPFVGEWCEPLAGRAQLTIEAAGDGYEIFIYWSSSAFQHSEWYMTGSYDPAADAVVCNDCRCVEITYDDEFEDAREEVLYTGGKASFTRRGSAIHWEDAQEDAGAEILFTMDTGGYLGPMTVVNCKEYVSLRSAPSTAASVITTIPLGAEVDAFEYNDTFHECDYQGYFGYVLSEYLE